MKENIGMIELWPQEWRDDIIKVCKRWIQGNLDIQEVKDDIEDLDWAVISLLPRLKKEIYASNSLNILIDDILGMDSISDEEKDSSIMELYERREEELKDLARRVIEQVEINHQEFLEEAEQRGYCPILTKNQ